MRRKGLPRSTMLPVTEQKAPSVKLSKTSHSAAYTYSLDDIVIPPFIQAGVAVEVKMSGDVVLTSLNSFPVTFPAMFKMNIKFFIANA